MATAAKAQVQPFAADLKVTMSDWNMSSSEKLLVDIFEKTVSIWVSINSVDIALSLEAKKT